MCQVRIVYASKDIYGEGIEFFKNIFGWKQICPDNVDVGDVTLFKIDEMQPIIVLKYNNKGDSEVCGNNDLVFEVSSLERLRKNLKKHNIKAIISPNYIQFKDPGGNQITLYNYEHIDIKDNPYVTALKPTSLMQKPKLGILTSGGDSQGMNAAIRAAVRTAIYRGYDPYVIEEGYNGLVKGQEYIKPFTWNDVADIISYGGTIIGTARCKEFFLREGLLKAVENLVKNDIHSLIVIGGDGSLTGGLKLRTMWKELTTDLVEKGIIDPAVAKKHPFLSIAGLVGSIDNDLIGTNITIGSDSSLHRIVNAIDVISTSALSHKRVFVIEVMGKRCGWLALVASICCDADLVLIPEVPVISGEWEEDICKNIRASRAAGRMASIVLVAEGAIDNNCNPITSEMVSNVIKERLNVECRITVLGHLQRGGSPSALDRLLGSFQAVKAVQTIISHDRPEGEGCGILVSIQENDILSVPLEYVINATQKVNIAFDNRDFKGAFEMRGSHFKNLFSIARSYRMQIKGNEKIRENGVDESLRIAIIHVGPTAGGSNSVLYRFFRYCQFQGHTPIGFYGGWKGILSTRNNIKELTLEDVDGIMGQGGSNIGASEFIPKDFSEVDGIFREYKIDGLIIVGEYDGYISAYRLLQEKNKFHSFNIPIILIPTSISNNMPGTEYTIGSDTALNVILNTCDSIRRSASYNKVLFVVKVKGDYCGFLALFSGISSSATYCYLPEEGIYISDIFRDSQHLIKRFLDDKKQGRLIIVNENASSTYTPQMLSDIFRDEANGIFDAKICEVGYTQESDSPSPRDRITASLFAKLSIDRISEDYRKKTKTHDFRPLLVGVLKSKVVFNDIEDLYGQFDHQKRVCKNPWWMRYRTVSKILSKYSVPLSDPFI